VPVASVAALDGVPPAAAGGDDGFGVDVPGRQTAYGVAVDGLAQYSRLAGAHRLPGLSRPCPSLDAQDGHPRDLSTAAHVAAGTGTQDLSVSAERSRDRVAEPGLVGRHYPPAGGPWLPVPGGDHGLA